MKPKDPEKFRKYVELVARKHGGLEGLRDVIRNRAGATAELLESLAEQPAPDAKTPAATAAVESLDLGRQPAPPEREALEAIIDEDLRPVIDVIDGKFRTTHFLWTKLNDDDGIRTRLETAMPAIGRIELPGHPRLPYGGTGFVVGEGLVMTNRHVAEIFATGLGSRMLSFRTGLRAGIDFVREQGRPSGQVFTVKRVVMIHPYWDMAIVEVDGIASHAGLALSLDDGREFEGREIAVVGYPAFDPRNPQDVQQNLFAGHYGVKRLQPGDLHGAFKTASFRKLVNAAAHDCSTLGGNSGSALVDLATGHVIALHFGGEYHATNYAVPTSELARDQRIIDAGVRFAGTPHADGTDWADWWQRADASEAVAAAGDDPAPADRKSSAVTAPAATAGIAGHEMEIEIPIRIRVSIGGSPKVAAGGAVSESVHEEAPEAMVEPEHDTDYGSRHGYDPQFLGGGTVVAMPGAQDPAALAHAKDGADVLHYQNFSLRMHAKRRIALVTACNVTAEPGFRRPEPGRDYTRRGLSGLGKNDSEKWFVDDRLDEQFQIPDVFFSKDRNAFDKGHICRRDDVAWGATYDELKRANGDSYHVTNCSPQVAGFNRSTDGEENWGDLENLVLSEAANERLCVFAGPVLADDDQVFHGVGNGGQKLLARIPRRFWKVVVARIEDGIAAYGFVLEQDLGDVPFTEFTVADEFLPTMYPLADIAEATGVAFAPAVLDADQFSTARGAELVRRSGVGRKQ
jgi:endonuclease G, mitochondrial